MHGSARECICSRWPRATTSEWFLRGTQPGTPRAIDRPGLLYRPACGGWRVDPVQAELGPTAWDQDVVDWLRRAHRGPGVTGRHESRTAYFWGERSWGGPLAGSCYRPRPERHAGNGRGEGRDHGGGGEGRKKKDKPPGPVEPDPTPPPSPGPAE